MTSKFEQLIEYVINDEEAKAKELFHDIVVEKSREIYENLMTEEEEEELDEAESTDKEDKKAEKAGEKVTKDIEYDDKEDRKERMDEEEDEEMDESMHGMMADEEEIMDTVEAEEEGMEMQEGEGEEGLEDRVVDLEDKLDELMAEFEALMGDEGGDAVGDEMGGDDLEMDDTETAEFDMDGEEEVETDSEELDMMAENVTLDKAPAPTTSEPAGTNTKSTVAFNSGAKGMQGSPVKMTGDTAQGRSAPKTADLPEAGKFRNVPGKGTANAKLEAATKPHLAQATGVNTKTPFPKG
jgi:hypothetical protein